MIKTIFIGTPDFSVPILQELIKDPDFDIVAVITQPDKPVGRKQILCAPPVKLEAEKNSLPVLQPKKIKEILDSNSKLFINNYSFDIIIVAAYAQIIPLEILGLPKYGCINVHASLLPRHRGASCIQSAILAGDEKTGITIMKMEEGLDTGPIIRQAEMPILPTDTAGTLFEKLSILGATILPAAVKDYIAGNIQAKPQDDSLATYAGKISKADGRIDWSKDSTDISRQVRAYSLWPSAWTTWNDKKLNILEVQISDIKKDLLFGTPFLSDHRLLVSCGSDALEIKRLQLEGKKEMEAKSFLAGNRSIVNAKLI